MTKFAKVAKGGTEAVPPVWLLRQAGRYLPEYRAIREQVGGFLELCHSPKLAAEVTMQPMRRFDFDAAIIFSDILIVPEAMGQGVRFEQGEGPVLEPLDAIGIGRLDVAGSVGRLSDVYEAIERVRSELGSDKSLVGFCGSAWTVASYMIGGRGSSDQAAVRLFALAEPQAFGLLMDKIIAVSAAHLVAQIKAGCDAVQLFESWAGNLDEEAFARNVIEPNRRIVSAVHAAMPGVPVIGFARGAGPLLAEFVRQTGVDVVGLDHMMPISYANKVLADGVPVQGNLDPLRLVAGGADMLKRVDAICEGFAGRPHIFNLGHGIVPQTPPEHVAQLVAHVRARG